jgi:hypothetical protein
MVARCVSAHLSLALRHLVNKVLRKAARDGSFRRLATKNAGEVIRIVGDQPGIAALPQRHRRSRADPGTVQNVTERSTMVLARVQCFYGHQILPSSADICHISALPRRLIAQRTKVFRVACPTVTVTSGKGTSDGDADFETYF